jgi:hypothetical protein
MFHMKHKMSEKQIEGLMVRHLEKRFPVIMGYKQNGAYYFTYYGQMKGSHLKEQMRAFLVNYFNRVLTINLTHADYCETDYRETYLT